MSKHYRLDGHNVVACSLMEWAHWFEDAFNDDSRRVACDHIAGYEISTVFIGLNYSFFDARLDIFETAVFDEGGAVDVMHRYATWDRAAEGHRIVVDSMRVLETDSIEITRTVLGIVRAGLQLTMKDKK